MGTHLIMSYISTKHKTTSDLYQNCIDNKDDSFSAAYTSDDFYEDKLHFLYSQELPSNMKKVTSVNINNNLSDTNINMNQGYLNEDFQQFYDEVILTQE